MPFLGGLKIDSQLFSPPPKRETPLRVCIEMIRPERNLPHSWGSAAKPASLDFETHLALLVLSEGRVFIISLGRRRTMGAL